MTAATTTATSRRSTGEVHNPPADEHPPTRLELLLDSDRAPLIVLLILVPLVCWSWIVVMARDMYGPMTGASAWMMTLRWDARHVLLLWAMWAVMMAGMMLPSAAPMLLLYGVAARRRGAGSRAAYEIYALAAGYVAVWALFSAVATATQRIFSMLLVVSPMMTLTSPTAGAALLVLAGLYQLTPLKRGCRPTCQSPLSFHMPRWRAGVAGAFRMGVDHGAFCLGCCWALMLLLFVGGVMNLTVIAALAIFVSFEKLGPLGEWGARVSGALLIAVGVWMMLRPAG
jgi:predicted metal-binding membrane protein